MPIKLLIVSSDGTMVGAGNEWLLQGEALLAGRKAGCDLLLEDSSVSLEHFRLRQNADGWLIEDLKSVGGTCLNGRLLEPGVPVPLRESDTIQAGIFTIACRPADEAAEAEQLSSRRDDDSCGLPRPPRLDELHLGGNRVSHRLGPERLTLLGRGKSCDIILDDSAVSRRHAHIELRQGRAFCRDLGSNNGTWVNGRKLLRKRMLRDGDVLELGRFRLRFVDSEPRRAYAYPHLFVCRRSLSAFWPVAGALAVATAAILLLG